MIVVKLGDITELINGYAFDSNLFNTRGVGLPIIRIRDVVRGKTDTYYSGDYPEGYEVKRGDLLIGMDGEFNIAPWQDGLALLNQRVCKIIGKQGVADNTFLRYGLIPILKQIEADTPFVTVKHLSSRKLQSVEIELPPIEEQRRIAEILARADRLRQMRRYALQLSNGYLQSVFLQLFGDLTLNPQNWNIENLGKMADIPTGVQKGRKLQGKKTVTVPYLRVANVQAGFLDLSEIKTIEALPADVEKLKLESGDILMTEGGDFDKLGRGAVWEGQVDPCIHQNHVFRVRLNRQRVLPKYFAQLLLTPYAKNYFLKSSKQTTNLATINKTQLRGFPVPIPPLGLQQEFAEISRQFDRLQAQQHEAARQANHLFATLLHRAFRGEL